MGPEFLEQTGFKVLSPYPEQTSSRILINCGSYEKEQHHIFHNNSTKGNVPSKYTTKILVQSVRYIMFKLCTCAELLVNLAGF